jgi:ankyrin repeat protein
MGQSVYRRVGYEFIPGTQDWRISEKALYADPSRAEIDFLEAVGRGDMRCLAGKSKRRLLEANKSDTTPLDISIKVAHSLKLCDALLSTGASPDGDGYWHPLIIAAEENLPEIASLLIQKGADPSAKDTEGRTARSVVEDYGHKETFGILVN